MLYYTCCTCNRFLSLNSRTCGTSDSFERRSHSPIVDVSMPSMRMRPPQGSMMRYSAMNSCGTAYRNGERGMAGRHTRQRWHG